ncbi:MAG: cation:proton antiporter [Candidatus Odinarchaeum yellowstonii]|uniref:Cation:proton antiporter n=1 Tax=Odinarchaeota yellowstonii (strain LCB_4) TaxID=1841599 RepID=A0AAF0IAI4_ODILC|nr:MAG: cation:proton antiporter [Candidatus Odinarchaeum yellowstonii]
MLDLTVLVWLLPIILPLIGAVLIPLVHLLFSKLKAERATDFFAAFMLAITLWSVINVYLMLTNPAITPTGVKTILIFGSPTIGGTGFEIDIFGWFMSVVFASMGFIVSIYSIKYMDKDNGLDKYYVLLQTLVAGMVGVVYAADLFTLFVFWEIMALSGYSLVSFRKNKWEPVEAGYKYLIMSAFGSTLVLFSISYLYGLTGTLNIAYLGSIISTATPTPLLYLLIGMLVAGFGVTASIVPFHSWLPDAHPAAPSGISAMLSGVVIKTGVYAILRIGTIIFAPSIWNFGVIVAGFAVVTMFVGNIMALLQTDFKRLLAFSSIANIGYIIAGLAIVFIGVDATAQTVALTGSLFHLLNHAMAKGLLFLVSGAFLYQVHTRDLNLLKGIGRKMPVTAFCMILGVLSLMGVPPLPGFFSKFMIIWGQAATGNAAAITLAALTLVNSALSVAYYLKIISVTVFSEPSEKVEAVKESHPGMLIPIAILAVSIFILGVWSTPIVDLLQQVAASLLNPASYIGAVVP